MTDVRTTEDFEKIFKPIAIIRDTYDLVAHQAAETITEVLQETMITTATLITTLDRMSVYALWRDGLYQTEDEEELRLLEETRAKLADSGHDVSKDATIQRFKTHAKLQKDLNDNPDVDLTDPKTDLEREHANAVKLIELGGAEHGKVIVEKHLAEAQAQFEEMMKNRGPDPVMVPGGIV